MSGLSTTVMTAVITAITSGGLAGSVVAFRRDKRDALQNDLDYTKEFRKIAKEEVEDTRKELGTMIVKIKGLELRIIDLETSLRAKDHAITLLVEYVGKLRDVLDMIKPSHPLPEVPEEVKRYFK